eukprot:60052_1
MLNNNIHPIKMSQYQIHLNRANILIQTKKAKKIKAAAVPLLHYDIRDDTPITEQHLLSLIVYCNTNELCTDFSSTFRISTPQQTLSYAQQRNREFANWSKLLRETV